MCLNHAHWACKFWFICLLLMIAFSGCAAPGGQPSAQNAVEAPPAPETLEKNAGKMDEVKVIALTADGIGDIHFTVKETLESMGCKVITVGLTKVCSSCPNKEPRSVTADYLLSEITDLSEYDAVFIASGKQHRILSVEKESLDFIRHARQEGLIIASICAGNLVIVNADIVRGVKIASHPYVNPSTEKAGGIVVEAEVVTDQGIITGGSGGGREGGGYTRAPALPLCKAIVESVVE
ncbi:MAG: DJ-1/PfpI family protein [Planctomycetes bacterium]|nr:DJ-1/PfpI family protein [Planctomycetota bacterium]